VTKIASSLERTVMYGIRMRIERSNSQFVQRAARVLASVVGVRSPGKLPKQGTGELNRVRDRKLGCRWCGLNCSKGTD